MQEQEQEQAYAQVEVDVEEAERGVSELPQSTSVNKLLDPCDLDKHCVVKMSDTLANIS